MDSSCWWSFLEQRGEAERWTEVGVPAVAGFLSWLRNGRTVDHALVVPADGPSAETLEARLAAVISYYRWHEAVFGVKVAERLMRVPSSAAFPTLSPRPMRIPFPSAPGALRFAPAVRGVGSRRRCPK
jgi:hypothetical protein